MKFYKFYSFRFDYNIDVTIIYNAELKKKKLKNKESDENRKFEY